MIRAGLRPLPIATQRPRLQAQALGEPGHRSRRSRRHLVRDEPQPRQRRELDSNAEPVRRTPARTRIHESRIRRRQGEVPEQLIPADLRERPQLLVLLPGEHLLRHPTHLRHAGTNQAERSGSDPPPGGSSRLTAGQTHIRWILRQDYCHPFMATSISFDIEEYDIKRLGRYSSLMSRPAHQPLGLHLTRVARTVSRAFDDALAASGGSLPVWLVLISLKSGRLASQRELAEAVGVQGATLTHHLNAMESAGLVTRRRDPANRRLHLVELTPAGDELFFRLRDAATAFDQRLRTGFSDTEASQLETLLTRLRDNISRP